MPENTNTPNTAPDPATDFPLFRSRRLCLYTLKRIPKGTDLYVKVDDNRETSFWLLHWSEDENGSLELSGNTGKIPYSYSAIAISEECAIRLLRGLILMPDTMSGVEYGHILKYVPRYFRGLERSVDVVYVWQDDSCGKYFEYFRQGPEIYP
jgi:hypothetical protein